MVYRLVHQRSVLPLACGLLALILSFAVQPVGVAQAGTLTVNANDGPLSAGDSYCTLREAIAEANDTVAPGTYTECGAATFGGEDTIEITVDTTLGSALPVVFSQIIINGNGHFVDGADTFRVLDVSTGAVLTINNLTLMNGRSTGGSGLRIRNGATVTVQNNSVITGNTGTGSLWGSGIHVDASTFNVYDSVISYNATIGGTAEAWRMGWNRSEIQSRNSRISRYV